MLLWYGLVPQLPPTFIPIHPHPHIHPLQKVWAEFWKQTKAALTVLALFLLVAWVVRGRAPWAP